MEPGNTVMLEPCDDASIIIQSVKDIVYTDAEANNTIDDKFMMLTNTSEYNNDHQVELLDASNMNIVEPSEHSLKYTELCRVCANTSNHMILILEGDGAHHDLCTKIHKYLPIRISENDSLPLQMCYHCTSTLLAWHGLLEGCLNAEQKLMQMQTEWNSKNVEKLVSTLPVDNSIEDTIKATNTTESNIAEVQSLTESTIEKDNVSKRQCTATDERSCNDSTEFKIFVDMQNKSKIMRNSSDITKDDFNGVWTMDNDEMNMDYNDVTELQSVQNVQGNTTKKNSKSSTQVKCSICSIGFSDIKLLHLHVKTHNLWNSQESYQCVECNKCFRLKDSLVRHLRIHNNERSFTCHICGKQFRDSGGLSRHLNDVHAKRKPFSCDICNKTFASNATRNDHRRTHTGERPYICDLCGKKFKSKACLYIHSKVHTNDFPHPCLLCNKKFRRRQELLCHMTTHTGEKNFICDICKKRFRIKSELARHTRTHSDEKPFICNKCGLKFRQRRYLNNHIKNRHSQLNTCQLIVETDH